MSRFYDPTHYRTINYLTVIGEADPYIELKTNKMYSRSICQCICGKIKTVFNSALKFGGTKSCGCMRSKLIGANTSVSLLGKSKFRWPCVQYRHEYECHRDMIYRCTDETNPWYKNYGGRGITVCERWLKSFDYFMDDMHLLYFEGGRLERLNNDKGYFPENCDYVTHEEQMNNTRSNILLTVNGEVKTMAEWARYTNQNRITITTRHSRGWSDHECIYGRTK